MEFPKSIAIDHSDQRPKLQTTGEVSRTLAMIEFMLRRRGPPPEECGANLLHRHPADTGLSETEKTWRAREDSNL